MAQVQVETFEQTETDETGAQESDPEALALIEKLGLRGQQTLVSPAKTRCPYRQMNAIEMRVYVTLFPDRQDVQDYGKGPIPLRVLQIAAHAKEHFGRVEVWSETTQAKDPVLVGVKTRAGRMNGWESNDMFILARWGEALQPFAALVEAAKARLAERFAGAAKKAKVLAEQVLADPRVFAADVVENGAPEPYFS